ncbi:MAG: GNVR domain-containing protein [Pseudomonadota bacterium]
MIALNSINTPIEPVKPRIAERVEVAQDDDTIDIFGLLNTLWLGKWLIALCIVIAGLIGIYQAFVVSVPVYRATSVVILDTDQTSPVDLTSVVGGISGDSTEVKSEIEVLRARSLMGRVVDRMDLVNDPEFNGALRDPSFSGQVKSQLRSVILSGIGLVTGAETEVAAPLTGEAAETAETLREKRTRDRVVSSLLGRVQVQNVTGSLVFRITVTSESPTKAALLADTIVELYIINQIDVKFDAMEQATSFLSNRVAELKVDLEESEAAIADFNADTDLVSLEIIRDAELELNELRQRTSDARVVLEDFGADLEAFQGANSVDEKLSVAVDPQLAQLALSIDGSDFGQQAFDNRFAVLKMRVQQNYESAAAQLRALTNSARALESRIAQQSRDLIELQQLTREAEATRLLYEYFLTRLKEISAQQGIQQADSRVLSNAVIPTTPSAPRKSRILALSLILGAMVGAGLVLLNNLRKQGFKTADELEAHTGISVLGQIPLIEATGRPMVLEYLRSKPTSAAAEAVRDLRTSVMLSNIDNPPKVIVSTSSLPGEGKTTQSLALAQNLSAMGQAVLLIEGDIRRRTLNEYFTDVPLKGIVSVLLDEVPFASAKLRDSDWDIDVLFGEESSFNAADIFSSAKFKDFIAQRRAEYDVIIIDTPPVLVVPDSRIIAQVADVTLLSVKWDSTTKSQLDEALRLIRNARQEVSGLVLSQVSAAGMRRYGYGSNYGAYGAYGNRYYSN